VVEYLLLEEEAVEDELDVGGGLSENQFSNDSLELVALAGMKLPRTNQYQNYFTAATHTMAILASEPLFGDAFTLSIKSRSC
jgi:hypothetical protein